MIERVIENWLAKANEREFQRPFCYMLAAQGYSVIHLSRHCAMEMGKDVIALDPRSRPCAFQLKAAKGKISLSRWRKEIERQVFTLVTTAVVHPSVSSKNHHRSFFVTNGGLDEEVCRSIEDMNRQWAINGQPNLKLEVIVGGQLETWAKDLQSNLWLDELRDAKALLELYLLDGNGVLPKSQLAALFESAMPFDKNKNGTPPSSKRCAQSAASAAVLTSMAISNFARNENHVPQIEAWAVYLAYLLALAERWRLPESFWITYYEIAIKCIYQSLGNLCDELLKRKHFVEGDPLVDRDFIRARMTWLVGLMGVYGLWRRSRGEPENEQDVFLRDFCANKGRPFDLWGESAIPLLLAANWYVETYDPSPRQDMMLGFLIDMICSANRRGRITGLPNPYYGVAEALSVRFGNQDITIQEDFTGRAFMLEALVHLLVRRNWKQRMKELWPDVTRLGWCHFEPIRKWHFYRWRNTKGKTITRLPQHNQKWNDLKAAASDSVGRCLPRLLKKNPVLALLFVCVYPHRFSAEAARWLDAQFSTLTL